MGYQLFSKFQKISLFSFSLNFKAPIFFIVISIFSTAYGEGPGSGSGGRDITADYVSIARGPIYHWLKVHGHQLNPPVDSDAFLKSINPSLIDVTPHINEYCNMTIAPNPEAQVKNSNERHVGFCYERKSGKIWIDEGLYQFGLPLNYSSAKCITIAHEQFRKMELPETDAYEISTQLPLDICSSLVGQTYESDCREEDLENMKSQLTSLESQIKFLKENLDKSIANRDRDKFNAITGDTAFIAHIFKFGINAPKNLKRSILRWSIGTLGLGSSLNYTFENNNSKYLAHQLNSTIELHKETRDFLNLCSEYKEQHD